MSKEKALDWHLINKMLDGTATPQESAKWDTLVREQAAYTALIPWLRRLQQDQQDTSSPFYAMDAWQDFKTRLPVPPTAIQRTMQPSGIVRLWKMTRIAAAIALIISICWWSYPSLRHADSKTAHTLITYTVPNGQQKRLTLPDSTLIWMNAGSSVKIAANWDKDPTREVWLEGEGYFEVRENSNQPFIVHATGTNIRVLGTSFNIEAYHEQPVAVTVATGKVRFSSNVGQSVTLTQDQHSVWKAGESAFQTTRTSASLYTIWREGVLQFRDEPLLKVISTLERKFNIPFIVQGTTGEDQYCTARFAAGESLDNILESLQHIYGLTIIRKEGKIIIQSNQHKK